MKKVPFLTVFWKKVAKNIISHDIDYLHRVARPILGGYVHFKRNRSNRIFILNDKRLRGIGWQTLKMPKNAQKRHFSRYLRVIHLCVYVTVDV